MPPASDSQATSPAGSILQPETHFPPLDGLRGVAILLVLIWHYVVFQVETVPGTWPAYGVFLLSFTWAGVDVFFVLSGFLIGRGLITRQRGGRYFRSFYLRRALRIFPLYYLTLALFVVASEISSRGSGGSAGEPWLVWLVRDSLPLWAYASFVQNIIMASHGTLGANWMGMSWSLAVEVQFYLVVPLLMYFASGSLLRRLLIFVVLSAPLLRLAVYWWHPFGGLATLLLLPARWDQLSAGVLAALAVSNPESVRRSIPSLRVAAVMSAIVVSCLLLMKQSIGSLGLITVGYPAIALWAVSILLLATVPERGLARWVLERPFLMWLGTVSYPVYLIHEPVAAVLYGVLRDRPPAMREPADVLITVLALVATLILSVILTRWIDEPCRRLGRRLAA